MGVDYREQYKPHQLEPFWPNEIIKMSVAVLCTLALIMFLAVLPVLLDMAGLHDVVHAEEPANPHGSTPVGIKPEWYFLAVYQHLRLMPTELLGISGKTLGVLSQAPIALLVMTLPFWYRRAAHRRPRWFYRLIITALIFATLVLTIWGGWPEEHVDGREQLMPFGHYVKEHLLLFVFTAAALIVFYALIATEVRAIRNILDDPPPADEQEGESS